jgi:hypothetical protein
MKKTGRQHSKERKHSQHLDDAAQGSLLFAYGRLTAKHALADASHRMGTFCTAFDEAL